MRGLPYPFRSGRFYTLRARTARHARKNQRWHPQAPALCRYLRQEKQLTSIFVEGGSAVHGSFLNAGVVDKVHFFMAPKLIGGGTAPGPIGGLGCSLMDQAVPLEELTVKNIGEDLWISAYVATREGRDVYRTCGRIG